MENYFLFIFSCLQTEQATTNVFFLWFDSSKKTKKKELTTMLLMIYFFSWSKKSRFTASHLILVPIVSWDLYINAKTVIVRWPKSSSDRIVFPHLPHDDVRFATNQCPRNMTPPPQHKDLSLGSKKRFGHWISFRTLGWGSRFGPCSLLSAQRMLM